MSIENIKNSIQPELGMSSEGGSQPLQEGLESPHVNPIDALVAEIRETDDQELYEQFEMTIGGENRYQVSVSAATVAGSPEKPNEDSYGVKQIGDKLVILISDGMTNLTPIPDLDKQGVAGARFASHFATGRLNGLSEVGAAYDEMVETNRELLAASQQFKDTTLDDPNSLPSASCTVAIVDPEKRMIDVAHVYDSWMGVQRADGGTELLTDDQNARFDRPWLDLMKQIAHTAGITPKEARQDERVKQGLLDDRIIKTNPPDGSGAGVLNGDPNMFQYIHRAKIPLGGVTKLVLGTDGAVPIHTNLEQPGTLEDIVEKTSANGLEGYIKEIKAQQQADPDYRHPRFKMSDDATLVVVDISPVET